MNELERVEDVEDSVSEVYPEASGSKFTSEYRQTRHAIARPVLAFLLPLLDMYSITAILTPSKVSKTRPNTLFLFAIGRKPRKSDAVTTNMDSPTTTPSSSSFLRSLLNATLRIKIRDDRTFVGTFICVDKQQNIILTQAEEFLTPEAERKSGSPISRGYFGGREVGMIMISGKDVITIEAEEIVKGNHRMDIL